MKQSIVKFIALYCSTYFGHYNVHHQEPVKLPLQPLWFPYECAGGSVLSLGRFFNKSTTAENTSTSTFIRKPEAATAI
jgi:hypothetical protein